MATLQYAYLEHFKKFNTQLSRYILPVLCANWRKKGHATALGWAATQPVLRTTIDAIEVEVSIEHFSCVLLSPVLLSVC